MGPYRHEVGKSDYRWWVDDPARMHEKVRATAKFIRQKDGGREEADLIFMRLYGNQDFVGGGPTNYHSIRTKKRLTLNVIKAVVDTVVARISKQKPKAKFLTSAGNYSLRRRAKLLERFVDAQFYLTGFHQVAPRAFLDACVFGTGAVKVYREGTRVKAERVFPSEILVDYAEGLYKEPQQIFQRKYVNRDLLMEKFPEHADIIRFAPAPDDTEFVQYDSTADQVEVIEAWRLPTVPGAKDGKHCICIDGATLFEGRWEYDYFPFVFIRWTDRLRGFWGMGIAEELLGIQVEINILLQKIQKAYHLMAVPQVFVEASTKVKAAHLNNEVGAIIPYTGTPPIVRPASTFSPEYYTHLWNLFNKAFEIEGVTIGTATGEIPRGLETGAAVREWSDVGTERFIPHSRDYEEMHLQVARMIVDLGREIAKENPDWSVVAQRDRNTISEVKWSEVSMEEDAYVLKVWASSSLPSHPSGRFAAIEEMLNIGMLDMATAKQLLDFPDLDRDMELDRAASDNIDRVIEQMLDEGHYEGPEPYQDLNLTLKKVQDAYNKAMVDGVPEDRCELLRQYMAATHELIQRAEAQALVAANQAPLSGAPPAAGPNGAPPTAVTAQDGTSGY